MSGVDHPAARLAALLAQENDRLSALALAEAGALLDAKTALLAELQSCTEAPETALARRLARLLAENRQLLERAMMVQGRVLGMIARAATRAQPVAASYGPAMGRRMGGRPAVALSASA